MLSNIKILKTSSQERVNGNRGVISNIIVDIVFVLAIISDYEFWFMLLFRRGRLNRNHFEMIRAHTSCQIFLKIITKFWSFFRCGHTMKNSYLHASSSLQTLKLHTIYKLYNILINFRVRVYRILTIMNRCSCQWLVML